MTMDCHYHHTPSVAAPAATAAGGETVAAAAGASRRVGGIVSEMGAMDKWRSQDMLRLKPQVCAFFLVSLLHTNEYLKIHSILNGVDRMDWARD